MQRFRTILGLLLIGGFAYVLIVAIRATIHVILSLNSSIAVAIIAAGASVSVSVLSIVIGKIYESKSLIKKEHREKKIPVYESLIEFMSRLLLGERTGNAVTEKETAEFLSGFTQHIMVWGSDEVLAAWTKWRRLLINKAAMKATPMKIMFLYEELIFAIRRDLGHKNKHLGKGDVLALFVNDIDDHIAKKRS